MPASFGRADVGVLDTGTASRAENTPNAPRSSASKREAQRHADAEPSLAPDNGENHRTLIDALVASRIYQDYERAFTEATGLPVALRPVESWQLPHHGKKGESPFCSLVAQKSRACAACLQVQETLIEAAASDTATVQCMAGMSDTAVPVKLGDKIVGYLQTGQVFR